MSIDDVRIEVQGRNIVSSSDWQSALNTPKENLPPLVGVQSPASRALGLSEEEDRRRILAHGIAHKRIQQEGKQLLKKLEPAFDAVQDFHLLYLIKDLTKAIWVITPDVSWVPPVALSDEDAARILSANGAEQPIRAVQKKLIESVNSSRQTA